jgi:hypothetical protein
MVFSERIFLRARIFFIRSMTVSKIPKIGLCSHTFFTRKIERTGLIITDLTKYSSVYETFIGSNYSLHIYLCLRLGRSIRNIFCMKNKERFRDATRIIGIRDRQIDRRIKGKMYVSRIAFFLCSHRLKDTSSKIPMTHSTSRNIGKQIRLTILAATHAIRIETTLNHDFCSAQIERRNRAARSSSRRWYDNGRSN